MRASYRYGVRWIAWNDEPEDLDPDVIETYVSTALLADLFGKERKEVAEAILRERERSEDG